jgi:hypothetical protein
MHRFGALGYLVTKISAKSFAFRMIFLVLAQFPCLWKSCAWHVNDASPLRTLFACSIEDSAGESIQF